jgi:hypothetical protein
MGEKSGARVGLNYHFRSRVELNVGFVRTSNFHKF